MIMEPWRTRCTYRWSAQRNACGSYRRKRRGRGYNISSPECGRSITAWEFLNFVLGKEHWDFVQATFELVDTVSLLGLAYVTIVVILSALCHDRVHYSTGGPEGNWCPAAG